MDFSLGGLFSVCWCLVLDLVSLVVYDGSGAAWFLGAVTVSEFRVWFCFAILVLFNLVVRLFAFAWF